MQGGNVKTGISGDFCHGHPTRKSLGIGIKSSHQLSNAQSLCVRPNCDSSFYKLFNN